MEYTMSQYLSKDDMIADMQAELEALRNENERLRKYLEEIAKDPRDDGICIGSGWDFYNDAIDYARKALK